MPTGDSTGRWEGVSCFPQLMDLAYYVQPVTDAVLWIAAVE